MRIYVAGPYSADPERCTREAIDVAAKLMAFGHEPFVPHLYHFIEEHHPQDYETWMRIDMAWLMVAEALVLLPGHSPGAEREVAAACDLGLPVFHWPEDSADLDLAEWSERECFRMGIPYVPWRKEARSVG